MRAVALHAEPAQGDVVAGFAGLKMGWEGGRAWAALVSARPTPAAPPTP